MPDDVRMHYTVAELPGPANVVPVKSVGKFSLRSFSKEELKGVVSRFKDIIKGAALIAGVDYELEQTSDFYNKIPVLKLNELLMENAKLAGAPRLAPPREKTGSTDFGNVMYEIPGSCIRVAFVPEGTSFPLSGICRCRKDTGCKRLHPLWRQVHCRSFYGSDHKAGADG